MQGADTSFLIDVFMAKPEAVALLEALEEPLCVSELVAYEFLCGSLREKTVNQFKRFLDRTAAASFERREALAAADLYRELKRKGKTRPKTDVAIAASYLANDVTEILTADPKDFEGIPGLTAVTY